MEADLRSKPENDEKPSSLDIVMRNFGSIMRNNFNANSGRNPWIGNNFHICYGSKHTSFAISSCFQLLMQTCLHYKQPINNSEEINHMLDHKKSQKNSASSRFITETDWDND